MVQDAIAIDLKRQAVAFLGQVEVLPHRHIHAQYARASDSADRRRTHGCAHPYAGEGSRIEVAKSRASRAASIAHAGIDGLAGNEERPVGLCTAQASCTTAARDRARNQTSRDDIALLDVCAGSSREWEAA